MKLNSTVEFIERSCGLLRFVSDVVVENEMQCWTSSIALSQGMKQVDEKRGVFAGTMDVGDGTGARIRRAGQIVFHILPRGEDKRLLSALDIGEPNAWIEVDVRFVDIENLLISACLGDQTFNVFKHLASARSLARAGE